MKHAMLVMLVACGGGDPVAARDDGGSGLRDARSADASPPVAAGCITEVTPGDHTFTCGGLQTDVRIPDVCEAPGCGLILELHGDTGTGLLMDGHTKLRDLGQQHGYIVVAPSGPPWPYGGGGSTWTSANDATLIQIVISFRDVFRVDPAKIHVTGFSRGSFVTWRLLCDHADLFASAAPGGGGDGQDFGETTCFDAPDHVPSRKLPILFLMGQLDASVGYASLTKIRDEAVANYGLGNPSTISADTTYHHDSYTGSSVIETFDHHYATVPDGPFGSAQGHCIPGSTSDPYAPQYAIPCKLPNSFVWGEEVMKFFLAHPMT